MNDHRIHGRQAAPGEVWQVTGYEQIEVTARDGETTVRQKRPVVVYVDCVSVSAAKIAAGQAGLRGPWACRTVAASAVPSGGRVVVYTPV